MPTAEDLMAFEKAWLNRPHDGRYESAVRREFGTGVTTHALRVLAAIEDGRAHRCDPVTAGVLDRRVRARMKQRSGG